MSYFQFRVLFVVKLMNTRVMLIQSLAKSVGKGSKGRRILFLAAKWLDRVLIICIYTISSTYSKGKGLRICLLYVQESVITNLFTRQFIRLGECNTKCFWQQTNILLTVLMKLSFRSLICKLSFSILIQSTKIFMVAKSFCSNYMRIMQL